VHFLRDIRAESAWLFFCNMKIINHAKIRCPLRYYTSTGYETHVFMGSRDFTRASSLAGLPNRNLYYKEKKNDMITTIVAIRYSQNSKQGG